MDMLSFLGAGVGELVGNLGLGLGVALSLKNLGLCFLGCLIGTSYCLRNSMSEWSRLMSASPLPDSCELRWMRRARAARLRMRLLPAFAPLPSC